MCHRIDYYANKKCGGDWVVTNTIEVKPQMSSDSKYFQKLDTWFYWELDGKQNLMDALKGTEKITFANCAHNSIEFKKFAKDKKFPDFYSISSLCTSLYAPETYGVNIVDNCYTTMLKLLYRFKIEGGPNKN
jgi:hypothetical protein